MDSPALSSAGSDFSDMTDEELDQYFANYVPLSNLPTPPPAKETFAGKTNKAPVYARHLSNLVPSNICTHRPYVPTIQSILSRANLPIEILAFAACILDALSQRFASSLRSCHLPCSSSLEFRSTFNGFRQPPPVDPEIVVVAALALALDFLEDKPRSNSHWARIETREEFTAKQIEATKRCILVDVDYGLFGIKESRVTRMMRDMQHATTSSLAEIRNTTTKTADMSAERDDRRPKLSLDLGVNLQGTAVWTNGLQTPEPSP
ncbi:hypothetical protein BCR34DRAFT_622259 [Clohesyomyces aquaticus]|uniref:Cyclin N-terminal domain-containing protein n=1 Tax=Clohesyomyces aquaticus TaxID=1231657 RepID=A0A1Y2A2R8_9PLEO|nr:hypothetical protein BCR34DRAFT_622259 [Clohesyomyces aquaticus]